MRRISVQFIALTGFLMSAMPAIASDGGKKMLPALDVALYPGVLFWMTVTFLALLIVMQFVGVPGVQKTIGKRQETLDRDLESARLMGEKAQATVDAYEEGLHKARMGANETVATIVAEAEAEAAEQIEKQSHDIKHRMEVSHDNIMKAKEDALKAAQPFIGELVEEVYGQVLQSGLGQATAAGK